MLNGHITTKRKADKIIKGTAGRQLITESGCQVPPGPSCPQVSHQPRRQDAHPLVWACKTHSSTPLKVSELFKVNEGPMTLQKGTSHQCPNNKNRHVRICFDQSSFQIRSSKTKEINVALLKHRRNLTTNFYGSNPLYH